ncbi:MAG: cell division protein FtsL [gamma proteobacterium endosymbiont of Lamellibrachia anaximandri]|nr:cell division protein FtsL [gamma proteobacterium endosymbiont of Lamellibrachia anaximandri]MBL3618417.1 cell division protein FtsL [gamma proteobacterium endosymbiont of Lamellibrachia anaximandri]
MSYFKFLPLAGLVLAVVLSGVSVVYAKYLSRRAFVELQVLHAERRQIDVEWGRLQLEESTLATHAKVEKAADRELKMHRPRWGDVVVIRR